MRIDINLASQPYQDSGRFWSYWGSGLALLSAVTVLLIYFTVTGFIRAGQDRKQIAKYKTDIAAYDEKKSQSEAILNQVQNRTMREQSLFLNELFERKAFSWTRVFEDLERVMPAHLHVISIHPDAINDDNAQIKLIVGGASREQAVDLIKKMETSKRFKQTRIEEVKIAMEQQAGTDPVQFGIVTLYVPGSGLDQGLAGAQSGGMH